MFVYASVNARANKQDNDWPKRNRGNEEREYIYVCEVQGVVFHLFGLVSLQIPWYRYKILWYIYIEWFDYSFV